MEDVLSTLRGGGNIDAALWQAKALSDINQERSRCVLCCKLVTVNEYVGLAGMWSITYR